MKKYLIIMALCAGWQVQGQNVDSLYNRFSEVPENRRVAIANEIARAVYEFGIEDSLYRFENDATPELVSAVVHGLMGVYQEDIRSDFPSSAAFSLKAATYYERVGDLRAMDLQNYFAANNYIRLGDYEKGIDLLLKCYELEQQLNDPEALSRTLSSLGISYSNWGNSEMAAEYFRKAVEIERPLNRTMQFAGRLSSLAKELSLLGNHDEALQMIREALSYDEKLEGIQREDRLATHHIIMGDIYVAADSLQEAETCYKYAVLVFEKINRQQLLASSLLGLGRLQLFQRRFADAIETLKYCVATAEKNSLLRIVRDANRFMYEAYKQIGNPMQALAHHEQYRDLTDSLFKEATQRQLSEFQVKYETSEKELVIERQQSEISRHKARQNMLIGGLSAAALLLLFLVYIVRLRTRHNHELAETNATKDKFFSIISHDLKNPAVAQRDALQLLLDNVAEWDVNVLSDFARKLLTSADGQIDMLYSLFNWTQIQTGRMPYIPAPFNLVAALQSDIDIVRNMAENKGVSFTVHTPTSAIVTGDDNMIATIVRNLLVNAVKFTAQGGTVTLNISQEPATGGAPPHLSTHFTLSVADTGIGITSEQIQYLFRLNLKHPLRGTSGVRGSGLGLIVCRDLLEKHGSQLHVESEEGRGSRFWFTLTSAPLPHPLPNRGV
jgi:signal transduction histidine kinase